MQISTSTYLSVEALVLLAAQIPGTRCTKQGLAEWINRSESHTKTIMIRLRAAGLVRARPGRGGGYYLARPAHRITVAEVFHAFDEPRGLLDSPLNAVTLEHGSIQKFHGTDLLWESLKGYILLFLDGVSLADLALVTTDLIGDDSDHGSTIFLTGMQSTARH